MILRASLLHAVSEGPLEARLEGWSDGGLFIENGRIADAGPFTEVRARHPEAPLRRLEGGLLLPGFVDAHVHFPQTVVIGALGFPLTSGLATGDRNLRGELHTTPERAYTENRALIERFHGRGGLRYAVTPRLRSPPARRF